MRVLVTGGAGFIGRHVVRDCAALGYGITVVDSLSPQVHGNRTVEDIGRELDRFCGRDIHLVSRDVRDTDAYRGELETADAVVHLAAETGTGQSMHEVRRYEAVNLGGTAAIMEALVKARRVGACRLVLASSRALYGEGRYECGQCGPVYPAARKAADMAAGQFEPRCPSCGRECAPAPTPETAPAAPTSFYGLTKSVQEQTIRLFCETLQGTAFLLRLQNVYGAGQSLKNPYTGILSIFANRMRSGLPISIFEDGRPSRDFVHVDDVARGIVQCLEAKLSGVHALNLGTGRSVTLSEVAAALGRLIATQSTVTITGEFRLGDVRHCLADLSRARELIGFAPAVPFAEGLERFLAWVMAEAAEPADLEKSLRELRDRGLLSSA